MKMPVLPKSTKNIKLPKMLKVTQVFPNFQVNDIELATRKELDADIISNTVKPGQKVALLVGSRGITGLQTIVKETIDWFKDIGAEPFIIPSMGSHGGGEADQQRAIIEGYGITEENMGVKIYSSMETVILGETSGGIPVYADKVACEADCIVPIVRVKVHTDFDGHIESGFCKMITIGLGKHIGCSRLHQEGFAKFAELIPEAASIVLGKKYIPFGVCIIENAHENVHLVKAVRGCDFLIEEPLLLKLSKSIMPRICFDKIDVLIVDQIGKDITGGGMDPNITGRCAGKPTHSSLAPEITRIVINRISDGSHGNAIGMGNADFITRKVFENIDFISTYANSIASGTPEAGRIPVILDTEEEALIAAIQTCPGIDLNAARVVKIKDTLHLINIEISESLLADCYNNPSIIIEE
jgi:hypothetical protein